MTDDELRDWIKSILISDKGSGMFLTPEDNARPLTLGMLHDCLEHLHEASPFYVTSPAELAALHNWWAAVQRDSEFRRMAKAHLN